MMTINAIDDSPAGRWRRVALALDGLSTGDALGGFFEGSGGRTPGRIRERQPPAAPWRWTDDTQMALAVAEVVRLRGAIDQDLLAERFAARYERARGYGLATRSLLSKIRAGGDWRALAPGVFGGAGSWGNGAAMRAAPLGAWFASDPAAAAEQAGRSSAVTHAHPEAAAGAIAVAAGAALAWQARGVPPARADWLAAVLAYVPPGRVRDGIERGQALPAATAAEAAALLGNGHQVAAWDTVPFALWCAGGWLGDYEEAIWQTLAGLGDTDTTCAIVGGIVALSAGGAGIPAAWLDAREPLPLADLLGG